MQGALQESGGDVDKAIEILRVKGRPRPPKRGERHAAEGVVPDYVHFNGRVGALVEINCETDFVARNEEFLQFARDVALHIASAAPRWVSEDDVPEEERERSWRCWSSRPTRASRRRCAGRSARAGSASGSRRSCS